MANILNPLDSVWTPEDFQKHQLRVMPGKSIQIGVFPSPSENITSTTPFQEWGSAVAAGIKHWSKLEKNPASLLTVAEALDELAQQLLQKEIEQSIQSLKTPNLADRVEKLRQSHKRLGNLAANLQNHDKVVDSYNQKLFFKEKVIGCPTHREMTARVKKKMAEMTRIIDHLEKEQKSSKVDQTLFSKALDELEANLANGLKMTKDLLLASYPVMLEQAKQLGMAAQTQVMASINRLFNDHYVRSLVQDVSKDLYPLPASIDFMVSLLGISKEEVHRRISDGKKNFIEQLSLYSTQEMASQPPPHVANEIQQQFLEIASKQLTSSDSERQMLTPLLEKIYLFETEMALLIRQSEKEVRVQMDGILDQLPLQSKRKVREKENIQDRWKRFQFPDILPQIMGSLFRKLKIDDAEIRSRSGVQKVLHQVDQEILSLKREWTLDALVSYHQKIAEEKLIAFATEAERTSNYPAWRERNGEFLCFPFDQYSWGDQQVFGEGVCTALNYRWIRFLIDHPIQTIQSADDLQEKPSANTFSNLSPLSHDSVQETLKSGVTPQDRMNQALYQVENLLTGMRTAGGVGEAILKRDGMRYKVLEKFQPTIEDLIDAIVQNHGNAIGSPSTRGLIDIGIFVHEPAAKKFSGGHTIGMQIDPSSSTYRFWDAHSGFYQYPSLEKMKKEVTDYMDEFYLGKYNYFRAGQYRHK